MSEWWGLHGEWLVWTLVAILATVAVSWFFFRKQRRLKTLDWMPVTNGPLLNTQAKLVDGLSINWMSQRVSRPNIMILRIKNTGREAIRADDFAQRISIVFDKVKVLIAIVSDSSPNLDGISLLHDLGESGAIRRILIEPMLLNAGEWFDVQLLFDGKADYPEISARFADQSREMNQVTLVEYPTKLDRFMERTVDSVLTLGVLVILVGFFLRFTE